MTTDFSIPHILTGGRLLRSSTSERRKNLSISHSPTDRLMSPCTRLLHGKRRASPEDKKRGPNKFNLSCTVFAVPFPGGDLDFILGTSSQSRRGIIDLLSWKYTQMSPEIDEKSIRSEDAKEMPLLIAHAKADALMDRLKREEQTEPALLLTADQIVLFEEQVREKPRSSEQATQFLSSYSQRAVQTLSAVVMTHFPSGLRTSTVHTATVEWKEIPAEVVERVVSKGDVLHTAGGFLVEDEDLQPFIADIKGGIDSVMGLPVSATICLMDELQDLVVRAQCQCQLVEGEGEDAEDKESLARCPSPLFNVSPLSLPLASDK